MEISKLKQINFANKKVLFFKKDATIEKVLVSNFFWWKNHKYFIGYLYNGHKVKPLHIMFPKIRRLNECIFLSKIDWRWWTIKKYNIIWDKVSANVEREFDGEPFYNKEFFKIKVKSHSDEVTDFFEKGFTLIIFV